MSVQPTKPHAAGDGGNHLPAGVKEENFPQGLSTIGLGVRSRPYARFHGEITPQPTPQGPRAGDGGMHLPEGVIETNYADMYPPANRPVDRFTAATRAAALRS